MLLLAVIELRVTRAMSDWMTPAEAVAAEVVAGVEAEDDDEEDDPVQLDDVMEKSEKVVVNSGFM